MYVVITGTSRGIGLELTRLALLEGHHVLAVARKPDESPDLMKLLEEFKNLSVEAVDLLKSGASEKIAGKISAWPCVDVLINNAGIYEGDTTVEEFQNSFLTNTIQPFFIFKGMSDKLQKSKRPVSLQITSRMGSIEDNTSGGSISYRASKAALNMIFKSVSIDEKWLISILVHPGWVQTRMGGSGATTTVHDSASGIWKIIQDAKPAHSGSFMSYKQDLLPW